MKISKERIETALAVAASKVKDEKLFSPKLLTFGFFRKIVNTSARGKVKLLSNIVSPQSEKDYQLVHALLYYIWYRYEAREVKELVEAEGFEELLENLI